MHSTMFGSLSFAMFPVNDLGIAFMGSFLLPLIRSTMPAGNLVLIVHANFLLLGFMVGAFGLLGNEVMKHGVRAGTFPCVLGPEPPALRDAHLLHLRGQRRCLLGFFLWVFPLGWVHPRIAVGCSVPLGAALLLLLTLTLAFLYGLCTVSSSLGSLRTVACPALGRCPDARCCLGIACRCYRHEPCPLLPAAPPLCRILVDEPDPLQLSYCPSSSHWLLFFSAQTRPDQQKDTGMHLPRSCVALVSWLIRHSQQRT